jgi:sigma-54 dependent transcriptional regulator, acetoin dehydrogenase operon transcriptional activator AcoR
MLQPTGSHARYIQSILKGAGREDGAIPDYVRRSWLRCLTQHHLDPQSRREPYVLAREERLTRKEQNLELVAFADAEMAHLYQQLAGSGYSIILSDRDGVLLDYYGDLSFRDAACRTGLVLGAVWSEEHSGTNGIGTCLQERTPLIIHRDQHFLVRNTGLSCCAAPIFDHEGAVLGALDASAESDRAQRHTLVLVSMSAQMIANRLFLHRFRDACIVRFHSRPELVGTWSEGLIALTPAGAIAAVDRNALFQLRYRSSAELTSRPLERVFNISLPTLLARSQRKSFHALPIYEACHGGRFFALAQAPQCRRPLAGKKPAGEAPAAPLPGSSLLDELDLGDPLMARNIQAARRCESRDIPILLLGESGTGKSLFARALHASSDRADRPFVAINCGSLPTPALRAELFGRAGSGEERGRIIQAHGGTVFLDDVGELPLELQSQLLHVIEERAVRPEGSPAPVQVDIRIVSASRSSREALEEKVRRRELREDLLYRLQGLVLPLPALRERHDRKALIRHVFAQEASATESVSLSEELIDALCACPWPGNIRQLRNVLRGLIALRTRDRLDLGSLPPDYGIKAPHARAAEWDSSATVQSLNPLERAERDALLATIDEHHGNISHVAHQLGIGRNTVYRKMRRLGIPGRSPAHR